MNSANIIINNLHKIAQKNDLGLSYNQLRSIVAIERLVARLEANPMLAEHLVFKGGFALLKLIENARFTRDLDASFYDISTEKLEPLITEAAYQDLGDGLFFYDIQSSQIKISDQYPGIRYKIAFQITESRNSVNNVAKLSRIHFDIALGDFVPHSIIRDKMLSILDHIEPLNWKVYMPEQIFSEKLQIAVARGIGNSRAKDIYDIVQLFDRVNGSDLIVNAIKRIFQLRKTDLPTSFYEFFNKLNVFILENAWRSVTVSPKPEFSNVWQAFLEVAQKIDVILKH